jgi:membrane protein implicated in regulation of membrane protease activity
MEIQILSSFSAIVLLAIGIGLIAMEAIFYSFILIWFGLASIIVALITHFIGFDDGLLQIAAIGIISIVLLFSLRSKVLRMFLKSKDQEVNDNFLNDSGDGIIKDGKVYFKATYWDIDSEVTSFQEGEKVKVLSTKKGKAKVIK